MSLAEFECKRPLVRIFRLNEAALLIIALRRVLALIFRPADLYSFVPWRLAAERGADFSLALAAAPGAASLLLLVIGGFGGGAGARRATGSSRRAAARRRLGMAVTRSRLRPAWMKWWTRSVPPHDGFLQIFPNSASRSGRLCLSVGLPAPILPQWPWGRTMWPQELESVEFMISIRYATPASTMSSSSTKMQCGETARYRICHRGPAHSPFLRSARIAGISQPVRAVFCCSG